MYLQIKSENPNLSYILKKNPASGMIIKSYRKGNLFGWFHNNVYNAFFKDGDDEISIQKTDEAFEHNDSKRYDSPTIVLGILTEFFGDCLKKVNEEYDTAGVFVNSVIINNLFIGDMKYYNILSRYYDDIKFTFTEKGRHTYHVIIESKRSVSEILMILYSVTVLYHGKGDGFISDTDVVKYINILNRIDAPYFIKYVFKSNFMLSEKKMLQYAPLLAENKQGLDINFSYGNTHAQRKAFILKHFLGTRNILDVGCGEMRSYGIDLVRRAFSNDKTYHAVDIDLDILEEAKNMLNRKAKKEIENVYFYESLKSFQAENYVEGDLDVIMSEFFEHVKLKKNTEILNKLLSNKMVTRILVTTPNKEFNTHYKLGEEMRLDDHVFEMNKLEFEGYFNGLLHNYSGFTHEFYGIGDSVDGVTPTQAVIIKRK